MECCVCGRNYNNLGWCSHNYRCDDLVNTISTGKIKEGKMNFHYHRETWYDDYVYNEVQRIQPK